MRLLLGTTNFEHIAGSELVLVEIAEFFIARGFECDLAAFHVADPMKTIASKAGITLLKRPAEARPLAYDLVWLQTHVGPAMDFHPADNDRGRTLFAFAHLGLRSNLTGPGLVLEPLLADRFMFPSPEAADHFAQQGLAGPRRHVFCNAAPAAFARKPRAGSTLRRVLVVSNHPPEEVAGAMSSLRDRGVEVMRWGLGGDVRARLLPANLDDADAVISIGKTVPYALRARVPVYVYDWFGGPGWLTPGNFETCAYANFSGRCCGRRLTAQEIAAEIIAGFDAAAQAAASWPEALLAPYILEAHLESLLEAISTAPVLEARLALLRREAPRVAAEKALASAIGHYFAAWRRAKHLGSTS